MKIGEYTVIQSPHLTERIFTRKQTRKFKNTRWVKKYEKKYSKLIPHKHLFKDSINKVIFCHPEVYKLLEIERKKTSQDNRFEQNSNVSAKNCSASGENAFKFEPRAMFYGLRRPELIVSVTA